MAARTRWEALALVALTVAALAGFFLYPTYSEYDSLYSLLWGRELLDGGLPTFDAYRAPTQHPLWVAICVPFAALGVAGDRVLLGLCVLSFVALVAGMYRLGRETFGWVVGLVAALLLLSRLDFPFLAARGYIDIPYLALIMWAAALEAQRPKRGGAVWVLLTLAGLMRPEAWLLAGFYGIWIAWGRPFGAWVRVTVLMSIAPVVWALSDLVVTGDPLYSLNYTTESARALGRRQSLLELPGVTLRFLSELTKPPVFVAALAGSGPISVPNHKLVPIVRWVGEAGVDGVVARTDPAQTARQRRGGVGLYLFGGTRFLKHPAYGPFDQTEDSPAIQVPPPGYNRARVGKYFSAYVRC